MRRFVAPLLACALGVVMAGSAPVQAPVPAAAPAAASCPFGTFRAGATCAISEHPETFGDMVASSAQWDVMNATPPGVSGADAYRAALHERNAMNSSVAGANGGWHAYGKGPLIAADPRYG